MSISHPNPKMLCQLSNNPPFRQSPFHVNDSLISIIAFEHRAFYHERERERRWYTLYTLERERGEREGFMSQSPSFMTQKFQRPPLCVCWCGSSFSQRCFERGAGNEGGGGGANSMSATTFANRIARELEGTQSVGEPFQLEER